MKYSPLTLTIFSLCLSHQALAADFNIPFVNTSGLGVAYADWATAAADASTSFTNPAGLTELPHTQFMGNLMGLVGKAKFTGTSLTPPFPFPAAVSESGVARSPIRAFLPSFFYSTPLAPRTTFGIGVTAPFGLGTDYGRTSIVRYAATRSQVMGLNIGPSLGYKLTDVVSIGAGLDALRLAFMLNNKYGPPLSFPGDSEVQNHLSGWGYGWHAGILFHVTPVTRFGISYNSLIGVRTTGRSSVFLPNGQELLVTNQETNGTLPARAQLSLQHDITQRWTGMASVFYTNWETFRQITMERTMTTSGLPISVTIPFNYHNCFDYSVGSSFKLTERWLLRGGVQFLNTPSNDRDRGIADPIGSATIGAIGARFVQSEAFSYDIGVGHSFFKQMPVQLRNQLTVLNGHTNTHTTAFGAQINWNIN